MALRCVSLARLDALALSQHQSLKNRAFAAVTLNQGSVLRDYFAVFAQNYAFSVSEFVRKVFTAISVLLTGRVFESADHSAADQTLDRAGGT
jgi:hypothetical protein